MKKRKRPNNGFAKNIEKDMQKYKHSKRKLQAKSLDKKRRRDDSELPEVE